MNKKSMSISIVLLVIMTLVLVGVSLTYFIIKENNNQQLLQVSSSIDYLSIEESHLDITLDKLFLESVVGIKTLDSKQIFIDRLNENIPKYQDYYFLKNLNSIKEQVKEENIEINTEGINWKVEFIIESVKNNPKNTLNANYLYSRKFEKVFKV
ncbi:MAG: hypothetical protein WC867_06880 [Candidatus Pacearchaeota archaeon]|jgi:hypothetical protein